MNYSTLKRVLPVSCHPALRKAHLQWRRWAEPIFPIEKVLSAALAYPSYWKNWEAYVSLPEAEPLSLADGWPCLTDRTMRTAFDPHYLYQAIWASARINESTRTSHVDIGSDIRFVGMLTSHLPVTFVDIRPPEINGVAGFTSVDGSLIDLPFEEDALSSLSCLHVIEHVGLGRYGDPLNPLGSRQACGELSRVLAPGGNLYFSTPVGRARVCFNAHRIHTPQQILDYFQGLSLMEFSVVSDAGEFREYVDDRAYADSTYACGLFHFRKPN